MDKQLNTLRLVTISIENERLKLEKERLKLEKEAQTLTKTMAERLRLDYMGKEMPIKHVKPLLDKMLKLHLGIIFVVISIFLLY